MVTLWELESASKPPASPVHAACIADLLGQKARSMGCRCPCPRCQDDAAIVGARHGVPDFKMRAANDEASL